MPGLRWPRLRVMNQKLGIILGFAVPNRTCHEADWTDSVQRKHDCNRRGGGILAPEESRLLLLGPVAFKLLEVFLGEQISRFVDLHLALLVHLYIT